MMLEMFLQAAQVIVDFRTETAVKFISDVLKKKLDLLIKVLDLQKFDESACVGLNLKHLGIFSRKSHMDKVFLLCVFSRVFSIKKSI